MIPFSTIPLALNDVEHIDRDRSIGLHHPDMLPLRSAAVGALPHVRPGSKSALANRPAPIARAESDLSMWHDPLCRELAHLEVFPMKSPLRAAGRDGDAVMKDRKIIAALNQLIEASKDEEKELRSAAEAAREPDLARVVCDAEAANRIASAELQDQVRLLGNTVEQEGSLRAAARRTWTNVRSMMNARNDSVIIEECVRSQGECPRALCRCIGARSAQAAALRRGTASPGYRRYALPLAGSAQPLKGRQCTRSSCQRLRNPHARPE